MVFGPVMILLAVGCWLISRHIPDAGAGAPTLEITRNIFASTFRLVGELRVDRRMWRASLIVSWFWLLGAVITALVPTFVSQIMGGTPLVVTIYSVIFAVSVAVGSAIAAWLCAGRVVLLPAPFGAAAVAFFCMQLAWNLSNLDAPILATGLVDFFTHTAAIRIGLDLAGLAVAGALLVVPSFTALQSWAPKAQRARIIAAVNVLNSAFIFVSGGLLALVQAKGVSIPTIFLGLAVANGLAAWLMIRYLPTNPLWDLVSILFPHLLPARGRGARKSRQSGDSPDPCLQPCELS